MDQNKSPFYDFSRSTLRTLTSFLFLVTTGVALSQNQSCPTDLFIGYYQEDAAANPEDPLPGLLYLQLPKNNGAFNGDFLFTFVGCQSRNIGRISGQKSSLSLNGEWSGQVDNTQQQGSFSGNSNGQGGFNGTYTVAGGKQNIVVPGCADYFIAPFGTWSLFSSTQASDQDNLLSVISNRAVWIPVSNSVFTQCGLIEVDDGDCNTNANGIWQNTALSSDRGIDIPLEVLTDEQNYILGCSQFDEFGNRLAFSKSKFEYSVGGQTADSKVVLPSMYLLLLEDDQN